jgi:hypothetical protein
VQLIIPFPDTILVLHTFHWFRIVFVSKAFVGVAKKFNSH